MSEQWDEAGEPWTDFVRKGKDFYREEMNNPAFFKLVENVKGKKILDLACGEGSNTRILARKGLKVVGVDFSNSKKRVSLRLMQLRRISHVDAFCRYGSSRRARF